MGLDKFDGNFWVILEIYVQVLFFFIIIFYLKFSEILMKNLNYYCNNNYNTIQKKRKAIKII